MSKSKLYTVTKEYMPDGIAKYVRKCRVNAVLAKLREISDGADKPVWKLAEESGFGNYEYFLRVFRQETGKSVKQSDEL